MNNNDKPFSVRMGFAPDSVQTDRLDSETFARLQDVITERLDLQDHMVAHEVATNFFALRQPFSNGYILIRGDITIECIPAFISQVPTMVLSYFVERKMWAMLFDLVEFILAQCEDRCWPRDLGQRMTAAKAAGLRKKFTSEVNEVLTRMNVGYRLSAGKFVPVHSREEVEAIETALSGPYAGARTHMQSAVALFSDRKNPDFANTVKEAITAVESIVGELTGKEIKAGLHQLAKDGVLPDGFLVPGKDGKPRKENPFVTALEKFWTYANHTSRHARKKGVSPPDRDTARFLLVTCASLVNYITTRKLEKDGSP